MTTYLGFSLGQIPWDALLVMIFVDIFSSCIVLKEFTWGFRVRFAGLQASSLLEIELFANESVVLLLSFMCTFST